ncbi:MAG: PIG-L deacetylase family protein [Chitinophagales bacterium]|nr:PIG-L family deacetylase [Bacteroidota bacterium]
MKSSILILITVLIYSCRSEKPDYNAIKNLPTTTLPEWNITANNPQKVLLIFPHPDDEIICAGTVAKMMNMGWEVSLLTLTQGESTQGKKIRKAEWMCTHTILPYHYMYIHDFYNNPWDSLLNNQLQFWDDHQDTILSVIRSAIDSLKPDILITYDDEIGGYGHQEHEITAQLVHDLFEREKQNPAFAPQLLYQFTLPDAWEQFVISKVASYQPALERQHSAGLPEPTVAVDIIDQWPAKAAAAACYKSQKDILNKFYLLPPNTDRTRFYATFNKEYFILFQR